MLTFRILMCQAEPHEPMTKLKVCYKLVKKNFNELAAHLHMQLS